MARVSNSATWNAIGNFLVLVLCSLPGIVMEFGISSPSAPFQRGLYCNDESIRYPKRKSTIGNALAVGLSLGVPFLGMLIIEWLLFRRYRGLGELVHDVPMYRGAKILCFNIHSYIIAIFTAYVPFLCSVTVTLSITNVLKYMFGRLRPHFLSVCRPNLTALQSQCVDSAGYYAYVQNIQCDAQADPADLLDARLSFPSGHASCSSCAFIYLALYLQFRMVWKGPSLLRPFFQTLSLAAALMITATRVSDYKHHWSDVFAGFFLGTVMSILFAFFVSNLYFFETPAIAHSSSSKDFITSPSDTDLTTIATVPSYRHSESAEFNQGGGKKISNI